MFKDNIHNFKKRLSNLAKNLATAICKRDYGMRDAVRKNYNIYIKKHKAPGFFLGEKVQVYMAYQEFEFWNAQVLIVPFELV